MNIRTAFLVVFLSPGFLAAQTRIESERLPAIEVRAEPESFIREAGSAGVLSGEEVRLGGVRKLDDLQSRAPNVVTRSGGSRSLNHVIGMRGLVNNAFYGEPAVALYVDDVPYGTTLSYDTSLLEVDRVDIFRGPQFTRWGRRGAAGLISIHSREPGDRFGMRAEAGYGNYDSQSYKLHLDGPLGPDLGFSLGAGYARRDGYLYNKLLNLTPDDQEGVAGRFSLLWRPADRWDVRLTVSGQYYNDGVQRYSNLDSTPWDIEHDFNGITKGRSDMESIRVRYSGEDVIFTSITARRDFHLKPASFDLDFSPVPFLPTRVDTRQLRYSQEFRLQAAKADKYDWIVGAYGDWMDNDVWVDDSVFVGDTEMTDKTLAVFGEVTRKFDNGVDVTIGLRGEVADKSAKRDLLTPEGVVQKRDRDRVDSSFGPKLRVTKHVNDDVLVYAESALSHRPGAYSAFNFNPELNTADMEQNWASEIGIKARLLDDRLEVSLAGFWYEIDDYQIERYLLSGFGMFTADKVVARGVELEALARPFQGLELSASAGWVNAEFRDHRDNETGRSLKGRHPPYIPEFTAALAAQYRHPSGPMARVEWLFTGQTYFDDNNFENGAQSGYGLLNARIGFEKKNWGVYLYGRNLTDKEYYSLKIPSLGAGFPGEPRTYGVMATLTF